MSELPIGSHLEVQRLLEENALLREKTSAGLARLHELQFMIKPYLLALYQSQLGPWELELLQAQCELARIRRMVELVQASINRGEPFHLRQIQGTVELELLAWRHRIEERARRIEAAQFRLGHSLSPEEAAELKKLYRQLVKRLHPDVHPGASPAEQALWLQVIAAYEAADLPKLRALDVLTERELPPQVPQTIEALTAVREHLRSCLTSLLEQLAKVETERPFSMRAHWEDDAWVSQQRAEITGQIAAAKAHLIHLEKHLKQLQSLHGSEEISGQN
jgi:hypothetical protein